jgi:hypothetical protein
MARGVQMAESVQVPLCFGRIPTIVGTPDPDLLFGTPGPDVILALGGDDLIFGGGGRDYICAGTGDDVVYGEGGRDFIKGGPGNDLLFGGRGYDTVRGDPGRDICLGDTKTGCELGLPTVITVMVVYTPAVEAKYQRLCARGPYAFAGPVPYGWNWFQFGPCPVKDGQPAIQALASRLIDNATVIFNRNLDAVLGQTVRDLEPPAILFRLVHVAEVSFPPNHDEELTTALGLLLTDGDGVIDEVHDLRDTYHADLVLLLVSGGNTSGYCGMAVMPGTPEGDSGAAFSVVDPFVYTGGTSQAVGIQYLTVAHEIGHNLGSASDAWGYLLPPEQNAALIKHYAPIVAAYR